MKASDVMVSNVITVAPGSDIAEVAQILLKNRISGVPVVDEAGRLVGIVSEGDLLHRVEAETVRRRPWWLDMLSSHETLADDFVRSHARKVSDLMTRKVVTVAPDTPVAEVASTLERNGIKRVPVVRDGKVVGIVSRANLIQALASMPKAVPTTGVDDATLREQVTAQLEARSLPWPSLVNVIVREGTVELWGVVDSQATKDLARVAAEVTPGVRNVADNLIVRPLFAAE